jgi:hypothetical protein
VSTSESALVVRGELAAGDLQGVEFGRLQEVIFENSLGGTVEAALAYATAIRKHGLRTTVRGKCYSACALAFLAGRERRVESRRMISTVMLHVARTQTRSGAMEQAPMNDALMQKMDELTGGRLTAEVKQLIRSSWSDSSGVAFVFGPGFFGTRTKTLYCDGTQGLDTSKCRVVDHADPLALGIVTEKVAREEAGCYARAPLSLAVALLVRSACRSRMRRPPYSTRMMPCSCSEASASFTRCATRPDEVRQFLLRDAQHLADAGEQHRVEQAPPGCAPRAGPGWPCGRSRAPR